VLRLWPQQPAAATAFLAVEHFSQVAELLVLAKGCLSGQLTSFEVLWNEFYRLTSTPPAPSAPPLPQTSAHYVLIECLGLDPVEEAARMDNLLSQAGQQGLYTASAVARTASERAALWKVREDTQQMEAQYWPTFHFDVSLPVVKMEGYLAQVRAALASAFGEVKVWIFGHLADGNLHIGIYAGSIPAERHELVEQIVYQPLAALGGSVSAEHGIGLRKKPYLGLSRTPEEISVMRQLKSTLDPRNILNPGKIFDL